MLKRVSWTPALRKEENFMKWRNQGFRGGCLFQRKFSVIRNSSKNNSISTHTLSMDRNVRLSKSMSYILRHGAKKEGVKMGDDGFVVVDELLQAPSIRKGNYTKEELLHVVETNDKKRFSIVERDGVLLVRANQGHSIEVKDLELKKITNPEEFPVVIHGTYKDAWGNIKKSGLSIMKRNHIHMATGEFGSSTVISGMRKSCTVMIYIDIAKAMADGIEFFQSANGVILTSGVNGILDKKYFKYVVSVPSLQPIDSDFPDVPPSSKAPKSIPGDSTEVKTRSQNRNARRNKKTKNLDSEKEIVESVTNSSVTQTTTTETEPTNSSNDS